MCNMNDNIQNAVNFFWIILSAVYEMSHNKYFPRVL